jgi:hypothetical protein
MQTYQIAIARPACPYPKVYEIRAQTPADAIRIAEALRALLARHDRN